MEERTLTTMENTKSADARIHARDRALSLLNQVTAGIAFAAVAGVGIFGTVSALTIPGVSASSSSGATASAATSTSSSSSTSTSSSTSSSGLQSSSGTVGSSSSSGVAVSGGS
ncbi:MAG: hypothetical protein E6I23_07020 [Chloroflexi bacterium]|nr:MAG: hypothetical protein E6I23_07020 [Chloroflexota bacterium]